MCLIIRKLGSDGEPLTTDDTGDHSGQWDVYDDEDGRVISKHNLYIEARMAAETLSQFPVLRRSFEESTRYGASHSSILSAIFSAYIEGVKAIEVP